MTRVQISHLAAESPSAVSFTTSGGIIDRELRRVFSSPPSRSWSVSPMKRVFDILVSALVLLLFFVPGLIIAMIIRCTSAGPAIFTQKRVGRGGQLFTIYKFRSMSGTSSSGSGPTLTKDGDNRITPIGRWLRKLKLDEFPQFYNVLRGDMSLIGPRPKLPQYAEILDERYRPGITGAASLAFRREEELLRGIPAAELDEFYDANIKPVKTLIDVRYMAHSTLLTDLRLTIATLLTCITPARVSARLTSVLLSNLPLHLVDGLQSTRGRWRLNALSVDPSRGAAQA